MANWQTIDFNFDIFDPLRPPLEAALTGLEVLEAILEALLDLIKPFLLDLLNPLKAVVAALLAAIRALINQIRASGFSILLVHPDFSNPDFAGTLFSVSGAYPGFESKVVGKFFDTADVFRPQYPPGSAVAMLVIYIGADSPGDLMGLLFALLQLIKHPIDIGGLPAPVDLKVLPVRQGTDAVTQFRSLFEPGLEKALALEWRMPQSPAGQDVSTFANQFASFYNQFRFPNFIVERTGPFPQLEGEDQRDTRGDPARVEINTLTAGSITELTRTKYAFPAVSSKVVVREEDGSVHRVFPSKRAIQYGSSGEAEEGGAQGSPDQPTFETVNALVTGIGTGVYKFLDNDPELEAGKAYYYRVRAFFGDATDYLAIGSPSDVESLPSSLLSVEGNQYFLKFSKKMTLGRPSRVVKGFVPRAISGDEVFQLLHDVFNAIRAGLLLNFEFPSATARDSAARQEQKAGWGTLGQLGGQVGPLKAVFSNSEELKANLAFTATARRMANSIAAQMYRQPALVDILSQQWVGGVKETVEDVLQETDSSPFSPVPGDSVATFSWEFIGIVGGITPNTYGRIDEYLAREDSYFEGQPFDGPLPVDQGFVNGIGVQRRLDLANFLRTALSIVNAQSGYLSWYSVTVGDLFPVLTPFLDDILQWLEALLKAVNSALQELVDIIEALLQKIRALKQLLETILAILDLLDITVSVSVLTAASSNGSAATLAQEILASENKPGDSPFGLHSGMVMTFGGPGQGFVTALEVLGFILTLGALGS